MANYSSWAQQQYPAPNDYSNFGSNWGQPTGLPGSGSYGVPALNQGPEMFSQPVVPQDWGALAMQGTNGSGFNSGAVGMGNLPVINDMSKSGFWGGALGPNGWGGLALGGASGLASTIMGMKQYGLAKKSLAENKRQFQLNYDAQKQTTNTRLEDRQRARVASNAGAYQSVGDYMGTNGIR